jgi:hypothetical protein
VAGWPGHEDQWISMDINGFEMISMAIYRISAKAKYKKQFSESVVLNKTGSTEISKKIFHKEKAILTLDTKTSRWLDVAPPMVGPRTCRPWPAANKAIFY